MKKFNEITEKLGRQLKDPKKEVMVVKKVGGKDKVITIDKSQEKDYLRKGWKLAEGKINQMQVRRQDMAKLAGLYSKAMKAMPGSPKQKAISKQIDQYRKELGLDESVNESVYKFLVVNTKTGEIESAGSTLDGRNGAKETKKEIERKGKKMQILQLKKKVSDRQMERMLGYTLKQSGIEVGKNATVVESLEEDAIGNFLLALNAAMFGAVWLTFVIAVGQELGVIKGSARFPHDEDELKTAKNDIARLKRKIKKNKQYKLDTIDKENLNNALKIIRNAKPTAFQKLKTKFKDLVKKNKTMKEAVSPAQQAAIAISKKERGEKPKNECADEKDFKPHMMYDPKTGKGVKANTYADHVKYDKMGYTHEKPEVKEAKKNQPYPFRVNIRGAGGATVKAKDMDDAKEKAFKELGIDPKKLKDKLFMKKVTVYSKFTEVKENYRTLATKGMGAEEKGKVKVGDEVDFYETERGDKLVGRVIKVTNLGYTVQSLSRENKGKKYTFKYHDRAKAKKLLDESRAYRDAMKSMKSRSATRGMATTKKDKDTEASDDDRKAANKNIIMQLRKAADLSTGAEIEFERGKGKVSRSQAQAALARFNALAKPRDKEKFQKSIRSLSDIKKILGK